MTTNYWCHCCGEKYIQKDWRDDSHKKICLWQTKTNEYFDTLTAEEGGAIKMLLTWFNSFKTLQKYLKNDEDISKIDRTGFFHESLNKLNSEDKEVFQRLRERERERESKNVPLAEPIQQWKDSASVVFVWERNQMKKNYAKNVSNF